VGYTFNLLKGPHEPLVEYAMREDGQLDIVPLLAEEWHTDDAVTWDFQLREGITFSDGEPCDAEAIKWNFDRILSLNLGPAGRLGAVESVEALDKKTVRITLPGPNADFLNYVTMMLMISPKAVMEHESGGDLGQAWAAENIAPGTGPFLIKSRIPESETIMERNPDYWRGWDGPHVDSVVIRIVKEAATRRLLIEGGEAHMINNVAFSDLPILETNPDIVIEERQAPGVQSAANRFRGPLADVNVRRALTWAFDREGFVNSILQGRGAVPQGLLYTQFRFHNPNMPLLTQDLDKARDYLKQSEYPNGGFELSLMILPSFAFFQSGMAEIFQENLKELNISLVIKPMTDLATYYASVEDEVNGDDMWAWSSAAQTPDYNFQARRQWHSEFKRPRGVNGGYNNPRMDALLEEDMKTLDTERRREIWYEIQEILMEDMPFMPFAIPNLYRVRRANVESPPFNPFNLVPQYYDISFKA
jgi:peptide/nickel transport system substrate-binding protein